MCTRPDAVDLRLACEALDHIAMHVDEALVLLAEDRIEARALLEGQRAALIHAELFADRRAVVH